MLLTLALTAGLMPSAMASAGAPPQPRATELAKKAPKDSAAGHAVVHGVKAGKGHAKDHPRRNIGPRRLKPSKSTTEGTGSPKTIVRSVGTTSSPRTGSPSTAPAGAPTPSAPILGGSFAGAVECCSIPPDPTMAAGPSQVVIATNDGIAAFNKNGTAVPNTVAQPCAGSCSLGTFFSNAVTGTNIFDPWLVFDRYINRYWMLAVSEADSPKNSDFLLGLSNTADVTDGWTLFRIDARTNGNDVQSQWCDYEKLGIDAQAIYLTCNMFDFPQSTGGFDYAKIRAMTKSQFINNTCCNWWDWWNLREGFLGVYASFSVQPAHMYGASNGDGEFLVNAFSTCVFCPPDELRVRHITNVQVCCVPGDQHAPDMREETQTVGEMPDPPDASQMSDTRGIDTGDHRLLYAMWQANHLSTGQTIECPDTSDACTAFTELDVSDMGSIGTVNDWAFASDGSDRYYPRVDANDAGNKTMVYTRSSSSEFASAVFIGIPNSATCTNCVDGPETTLQAGGNSYVDFGSPPGPDNRWGDYHGAAPDPDGVGIWIHGEFAQATVNNWATRVGLTREAQDLTPPVTTASLAPPPTGFGWNNTNVVVTLNATDARGVKQITYSATGANPISTTVVTGSTASFTVSAEGITTVSFFAQDNWGNIEATKTQIVRIDKTAPTVTCGSPDGLWHATDVTIACSASDSLSGLVNLADASLSLSTSVAAGTETANACTNSYVVLDRANNPRTAGPICGNMVDKKAPTIGITTPTAAAIYLLNQPVPAAYACSDGGSGVATCIGNVANGSNIDTASVGNKTFTVVATDNVGNVSTSSVSYIVTYKICLLYDPTVAFHGNSIPIRLQLCDFNNVNVSSPGVIVHATLINPGAIVPTSTANPTNDFLFNSGSGGYVYILNAKPLASGSYTLEFTVSGDPITHSAAFIKF
jgi:hypothetical protein